jgi:hypothetical protein
VYVCVEQAAHNVKLESAKYAPMMTFFMFSPELSFSYSPAMP